jgi:HPr kinase/phosphorylase
VAAGRGSQGPKRRRLGTAKVSRAKATAIAPVRPATERRGRDSRVKRRSPEPSDPAVTVGDLLASQAEALGLTLVAGKAGLRRTIHLSRVQRPGLALTGYTDYIRYGRVQIMGGSEVSYLRKLPPRRRAAILARLARCRISCFVVTKGLRPPQELLQEAEARGLPVLVTPIESTPFIKGLTAFLDERLAMRLHLHSVLMDVFGLGVLIVGESGIGKSECALDLIDRGHRLVADDVVEIKRMGDTLMGSSPDLTRYHMELRGLGVINIKDLYGVSSIRMAKRVELVVSLERWEPGREYDRLGLHDEKFLILGVERPLIRMPVAPGRNIAILVEVAARNQLLKERGYDAARRFAERVDEMMEGSQGHPPAMPAAAAELVPAAPSARLDAEAPGLEVTRAARRLGAGRPKRSSASRTDAAR